MAGDVIHSPVWRPGQKLRFALTAGLHLPGSSVDSGVEGIKRLIEMNGGEVDCWIDENAKVSEGEELLKWREGVDKLNLTNYIVVSKSANRNLDPEVTQVHEELIESATNKNVIMISLEDLLSRMSWKNVSPIYNFGSQTFTPEMRVVPQPQGAHTKSNGVVSPVFTPENPATRANARSVNPTRTSSGVVSPYFDSDAPPSPASSGGTSGLFRPRSPSTGGTTK
jgi:hypothetical protein